MNPIKFYFAYILDIANWLYFRRVIKRHKDTPAFKAYNLRVNTIGEVYTVVHLQDEDLGEPDEILKLRYLDVAKPYHLYISSLDIQFEYGRMVVPDVYSIPDDPTGLLLIWSPNLQLMSVRNTLLFAFYNLAVLALGYFGYSLISSYL